MVEFLGQNLISNTFMQIYNHVIFQQSEKDFLADKQGHLFGCCEIAVERPCLFQKQTFSKIVWIFFIMTFMGPPQVSTQNKIKDVLIFQLNKNIRNVVSNWNIWVICQYFLYFIIRLLINKTYISPRKVTINFISGKFKKNQEQLC